MWITLTDVEQKLAQHIAQKRHHNARRNSFKNSRIGDQSDEFTDLNGIAAEIAWCKVNNVYPDLTIVQDLPLEDAVARSGERIDIKTTRYRNGHLIAAPWKSGAGVDWYCLVIGEFPRYRIAGYMSACELLQESNKKDFGHGAGYAAAQSDLNQNLGETND